MSGRGKGGKGLGKGGAKRHRKILRDNIQVRFNEIASKLIITYSYWPSLTAGMLISCVIGTR